jgi:hypothetical protein
MPSGAAGFTRLAVAQLSRLRNRDSVAETPCLGKSLR